MDILELLKYFLIPTLLAYVAYNENDKMTLKGKAERIVQREEIEKLVDLKLLVQQVEIKEIKSDLMRIESKLDKLIDKLTN